MIFLSGATIANLLSTTKNYTQFLNLNFFDENWVFIDFNQLS